jgi:acyl carrier protein
LGHWFIKPFNPTIIAMTLDQVYERLTPIFRDVFDDSELVPVPTMTAKDVSEWDSLNHIRLMVAVEKAFNLKFTTAEVSGFRDVGHLAETIQARSGS